MTAPFSTTAWDGIANLRQAIYDLPFNRELADGTLSRDRFQFYILQDSIYLAAYSRTLSLAAAKAPDAEAIKEFSGGAKVAIEVEQALHASFFEQFGLDEATVAGVAPSPTCAAYTNFLLATAAVGSYGELVAAILPCFWIYWDVGGHIADTAAEQNFYQAWIDTYADEAFGEATRRVIAICDRAYEAASARERQAMFAAFNRCSQYEWMFWDSAYRRESWPIGSN